MRILVTISRDWDDYARICQVIEDATYGREDETVIVHGASQMDWFIAGVAYAYGARHEPHSADWRPNGVFNKLAGFERNQKMVDLGADKCLAFIKDASSGASDCARRAEAAGIPTKRYTA